MADQLALVGVFESLFGGDLARLAEVVQQAAGGDQVAVELRVVIADAPAELHHAQGVLAQAAHEGVVDALRRRGAAEGRRQLRIVEERFEQRADVAVAHLGDQRADLREHRVGVHGRRVPHRADTVSCQQGAKARRSELVT